MERRKYRTYTPEFKEEALRLLASSGRSASELERELGITPGTLLKWRERYKVGDATQRLEPSDLAAAQVELRRVRRELAVVTQERDILKKAIAIFSKEGGRDTNS
jgi:transposase